MLFVFVLYTENVNTFGNITYKDNEHLAVNSLGVDGVLSEKIVNDLISANMCRGTDYSCFVTMVTGVYLQLGTQCGNEERFEGCSPVRYTCLHHGTIRGLEDFNDTLHS